ncbi:MAG: GAF domain-containing protein [Anaerolineae bacterium]|nr:GAF domain-containing protein [Anaerolineae bacterium]
MSETKSNDRRADWWICIARWPVLIGLFLVVFSDPLRTRRVWFPLFYGLLLAAIIYSIILTLLIHFQFSHPRLPLVTTIIDSLLFAALVYTSGRSSSLIVDTSGRVPSLIFFFALFPICVAIIHFGFVGGLSVVGLFSILRVIFLFQEHTYFMQKEVDVMRMVAVGTDIAVLFLAAALGGLMNRLGPKLEEEEEESEPEEVVKLREAQEQLKEMFKMAGTLGAQLDSLHVLETMLDVGLAGFEEVGWEEEIPVGIVFLLKETPEGDRLYVATSRYLDREDEARLIAGKTGLLGEVIESVEPLIHDELKDDPELGQFLSLQKCQSAVCVPLQAEGGVYGVLLFASPESDAYTTEFMESLAIYCDQAVTALQNAEQYQDLYQEKEGIIAREEQARQKLVYDLRRGPLQTIKTIAIRLGRARAMLTKDPKGGMEELARLEVLTRRTVRGLRALLFSLQPMTLKSAGLEATLERYVQQMEGQKPAIHLDIAELGDRLSPKVSGVVFSIIEEAIANAREHAEANNISVQVGLQDNLFIAQIKDDGKGFYTYAERFSSESMDGLGLSTIESWAKSINGKVAINSTVGRGTTVTLTVPLQG